MSKTIYEVTLLELLPPNLRNDPDIIAASRAADVIFHQTAQSIKNCHVIVGIDNAKEEIVDMLAIEMNADFYDQTLPLDKKRAIVKNAYVYKYQKGTAFAVKQVVSDAFAAAIVEEWFEYSGQPYHFRVITETLIPDIEIIDNIFKAIRAVKNMRSKLDALAALKNVDLNLNYFGAIAHQGKYYRITQQ